MQRKKYKTFERQKEASFLSQCLKGNVVLQHNICSTADKRNKNSAKNGRIQNWLWCFIKQYKP